MEYLVYSTIFLTLATLILGWALIIGIPLVINMVVFLCFAMALMEKRGIAKVESEKVVLVVDDDYNSIVPLLKLLQKANIPFRYVESGFEAIKEISRGSISLIFMDQNMPVLNGREALARADQQMSKERGRIPVIVFSGDDSSETATSVELSHLSIIDCWNKSMNLFRLHSRLNHLRSFEPL